MVSRKIEAGRNGRYYRQKGVDKSMEKNFERKQWLNAVRPNESCLARDGSARLLKKRDDAKKNRK